MLFFPLTKLKIEEKKSRKEDLVAMVADGWIGGGPRDGGGPRNGGGSNGEEVE